MDIVLDFLEISRRFRFNRVLSSPIYAALAVALGSTSISGEAVQSSDSGAALRLLKRECFSCHNDEKRKGGLVLTSPGDVLKGSDSGAVVVKGHPETSKLIQALAPDADPHMPPKKQLSEEETRMLSDWVRDGLPWDANALEMGEPIETVELAGLPAGYAPSFALALSPGGERLAVSRGGRIFIYGVADGEKEWPLLKSWEAHRDAIKSLDWSRDGAWLAAGGFRQVTLWDGENFEREPDLDGELVGTVTSLRFVNDHELVLADGAPGVGGFIRIVDIDLGSVIRSWKAHAADAILDLALSQDGTMVATAGADGLAKVFELSDGREVAVLEGHAHQVLSVGFSPDAALLATGGVDKELRVWDIKTRDRLMTLGRKRAPVTRIAWPSEDGLLFAATDSGEVYSYKDLKPHAGKERSSTGDERKINSIKDAVVSLAVARDGKLIMAGGHDGGVEVWNEGGKGKASLKPETPEPDEDLRNAPSISFVRDVLPVLSRAGCNAGGCHAKPEGQNGFKLSVFSYDPAADYAEIVKDARGRRIFPAAPGESLIIKKPITALPHEGGTRFEMGSDVYQLLTEWIRQGMPYQLTNEPSLKRIEIAPQLSVYEKGQEARLRVVARYSDGSERDVTSLASYVSNDTERVNVNEDGVINVGGISGQAVVIARYMGFVADAPIFIPADREAPRERFVSLPRNNFIDELAYEHFQKMGLFPSELCTDEEFIRRVKLDAIGLLPTVEEAREFLTSDDPDKRTEFIEKTLEHPAYGDYWANKWADLVRPNPDRVGVKSVYVLDQWLRESFRANKPYDEFAREIVLAEGSTHRTGPAVIYRDRREPSELTTMFSQLFLGVRLECAKCHHHPNEKWSQDDFYQFAAYFSDVKRKGTGLSPPISGGSEIFYSAPGGKVKHPVSGAEMAAQPLAGKSVEIGEGEDPRRALAEWLVDGENPFFAKAAVNRVWGALFGRGLVDPVDDFRISNPCVNPELLNALAEEFRRLDYDYKKLIRLIMSSRVYQLSSTPNEFNRYDTSNFSRSYRRRLPAETLLDAVDQVTETTAEFDAMAPGARAMQAWSYKIDSHFLDAFGRPNSSSDCPCERDLSLSVVQSLHLMNSGELQEKLEHKQGRARRLAESELKPEEIISELYLAVLSRFPEEVELDIAMAAFDREGVSRQDATEDVLWALVNSAEFVLNH